MCCILIKVQQAIDTIIFFKSKPRTFDKQHYENSKIWLTFVVNLVLILSATLKTSRSAQERLLDFNQFIVGWRCEKTYGKFFSLNVLSYRFNKSWPKIKLFYTRAWRVLIKWKILFWNKKPTNFWQYHRWQSFQVPFLWKKGAGQTQTSNFCSCPVFSENDT